MTYFLNNIFRNVGSTFKFTFIKINSWFNISLANYGRPEIALDVSTPVQRTLIPVRKTCSTKES